MHPVPLADVDVDDFVRRYERARAGGGTPCLDDFLPPPTHPSYLAILRELVCVDLDWNWTSGRRLRITFYLSRYPQLATDRDGLRQLAFEEYRQRLQHNEKPRREEYQSLYGIDTGDWPSADTSAPPDPPSDPIRRPSDTPPAAIEPLDEVLFDQAEATRKVANDARQMIKELQPDAPQMAARLEAALAQLPEVGEEFLGFRLIHQLGKGAFGSVFLARQGDLAGRLVALKVTADLTGESDRLAQLQHTNIMPIYSVHRGDVLQAICMPFYGSSTVADLCRSLGASQALPTSGRYIVRALEQRSETSGLASALREQEPSRSPQPLNPSAVLRDTHVPNPDKLAGLTAGQPQDASAQASLAPTSRAALEHIETMTYVDAILWMAARLADGLAHAHERGIIHRDLKPANILLTDDGQPMLLDFNLAEDLKQQVWPAAAQVGGTLPYMAPEHLEVFGGGPRQLDARADIYSLGLVLYQLLTGRLAFPSRTGVIRDILPQMLQDRQGPLPQVRPYNRVVSPAVESIVQQCLQPDPQRRYACARALQEDIDRHLGNLPLKYAPNRSVRERLVKWTRRHPRLASPASAVALAAAGVLLLAALSVHLSLESQRKAEQQRREAAWAHYYDDFQKGFARAEQLLASDNQEQILEGSRLGQQLLADYQVLDDPDWETYSRVKDLPPTERTRLRREVGELAFLLARVAYFRPETSSQAKHLNEVALKHLGANAQAVLKLQQAGLSGAANTAETFRQVREQLKVNASQTGRAGFLLACEQTAQGRYREALPLLEDVLREAPDQYGPWFLKGCCHEALGEVDSALSCYGTCIALRPNFARSYTARAFVTYTHQRDLRQAKADLDQALRLEPNLTSAVVDRATVLTSLRMDREAIKDLDKVLAQPDAPTRAWFLRAAIRQRLNDAPGAKQDREEGLKRQPNDAVSWVARGYARLNQDPKEALNDFREAEKRNPRSIPALINQAHVLGARLKQPEDALVVLDRLLKIYPDHVNARAGRGILLARLGRTQEALVDARASLAASSHPENLFRVAGIYALVSKSNPQYMPESKRLLAQALLQGWGFQYLAIDDDLNSIRNQEEFRQVVKAVELLQAWKAAPAQK